MNNLTVPGTPTGPKTGEGTTESATARSVASNISISIRESTQYIHHAIPSSHNAPGATHSSTSAKGGVPPAEGHLSVAAAIASTTLNQPRDYLREIQGGPRNFGSLIRGVSNHLTLNVDKTYFRGRAGVMRVITLILATLALNVSLPGYSQTPDLYAGYGETCLGVLSIASIVVCILISVAFIFLLLLFRENMSWHAVCSFLAVMSCIFELASICWTAKKQCDRHPDSFCPTKEELPFRQSFKPALHLPYKNWHSVSCFFKVTAAMCYSFCSRKFLKNDESLE